MPTDEKLNLSRSANTSELTLNENGTFSDDLYFDAEASYAVFDGNSDVPVCIPIEVNTESKAEADNLTVKTAHPKKKKTSAASSKKKIAEILNDFFLSIPDFVAQVGDITVSSFAYIFKKYGSAIAVPFVFVFSKIITAFSAIKANIKLIPSSFSDEIKGMRYEIKIIRKQAGNLKKGKRRTYFKAMRKYFIISFSRHSLFWKTVFNTVFPVVMVIAVALALGSAQNKIYALKVIYNGVPIGFVENENVFEKAKSQALQLLVQSDENKSYASALSSDPEYKLSRIDLSELNNKDMICENIITASNASLVRACGIYIDGDFLCAVKNETDASSVFSSILAPSKNKASDDTIVAFVEEVNYVQGLYPEDVIWDSMTLKNTLAKPKSEARYHKLKKNESAKSVAKTYSLTLSQLKALNPKTDFSNLTKGTNLLVSAETNYVRVKVMKTRVRMETIPFETVRQDSSSLSKGTTKVYQEGKNGKYTITELVTYINGVETYSTTVSKKQTVAPKNKIILVGTKVISYSSGGSYGTSGGYSGGSSGSYSYGGMIWPARGAYSISSRYGYRSASISGWSFHGGVDIVRSGGGSTGTPVVAAASGTVVSAVSGYSGYGHCVVIDHGNGLRTRYAHMQAGSIMVYPGQRVYQGQQIGRIGGTGNVTGPHLHFEVLRNGSKTNPLNYIG